MKHCACCSSAIEPNRTLCDSCADRIHDEGRERCLRDNPNFDVPFRLEGRK
jgi:predicted amidophosphoribosyltransferase